MVSDEALKKLQEQIAAWPMERRFVVQQLIRDYLRNREDLRAYEATRLTPRGVEILKEEKLSSDGMILLGRLMGKKLHEIGCERLHELVGRRGRARDHAAVQARRRSVGARLRKNGETARRRGGAASARRGRRGL